MVLPIIVNDVAGGHRFDEAADVFSPTERERLGAVYVKEASLKAPSLKYAGYKGLSALADPLYDGWVERAKRELDSLHSGIFQDWETRIRRRRKHGKG